MSYRNRIRELREDHDLTQKQAADIFFMQLTQYRRYEVGERAITLELACMIADYYHVSLDYLAGKSSFDSMISLDSLSEAEKQIITDYRRLNSEDKIRLSERLNTLIATEKQ